MAMSDARIAHRPVHVHGAEVSTDGDSLWGYAEAIALMIAIVATLGAIWLAAMPSEGADLAKPAPVISTPSGEFTLAEEGVAVQPDPDGAQEVVVVVPGAAAPDAEPTFGDPFGTGLGTNPAA
jgi:hypothetical protein